jgi:hypothetical protein
MNCLISQNHTLMERCDELGIYCLRQGPHNLELDGDLDSILKDWPTEEPPSVWVASSTPNRISIEVTYEDGNTNRTWFNGTLEEAKDYYIGQEFQFGDTDWHPKDKLVKAVDVKKIASLKVKAAEKSFTIYKDRKGRTSETSGTLQELIKNFSYTLETGKSYESEKGNKKINLQPKTIGALVKALNDSVTNSAANGSPSTHYYLK